MDIMLQTLKNELTYCRTTGKFFWKYPGKGRRKSGESGCYRKVRKYVSIRFNNKEYRAHKLAWFYVYGEWPSHEIDHINGDPWDNRIINLRLATREENARNRKTHRNSVTGYKGVFENKRDGGYRAYIRVQGKSKFLGNFDSAEMAALVYDSAAKKYYKEFARLNFPV